MNAAAPALRVLRPADPAYPELLREVPEPPASLYVRGELPVYAPAVAIVGSRRASAYGRRTARRLAAECVRAGLAVVSGLARGVDAEAHLGALEAGGITWAALGSGLDRVYPAEHAGLAERIAASGGAVLSELPPESGPDRRHFPRRNRIVSGLSLAVVVVEGDEKSGALITARAAAEQGREVFAVPGPVDSPLSAAPNRLLKDGAGLCRSVEDLLENVEFFGRRVPASAVPAEGREAAAATQEEEKILELLGSDARTLEDLIGETGWPLARLVQVLSYMEGKGLLSPLAGQRYARS